MSIEKLKEIVDPELAEVNEIIIEAAKSDIELIPKLAKHLIDAGGKRVRPILTLACAKMCGYEGKRQINLAACVEFMHTATLLHDDVVDESELRRGRQTANDIWGNKASVLVGDYLLGRAFVMMTADGSLKVLQILSSAAARIAEGEVMQLSTANNIETTYEEYIEVIEAKTAELFGAACEVGAAITDDDKKCAALREFGLNFGIAFQIVDDALDYVAAQEDLGKTVGDDFREGKVTLPIIYAYETAEDAEKEFWRKIVSKDYDFIEEDLQKVQEIIQNRGLLARIYDDAEKFAKKAEEALSIFEDSEIKNVLLDIVNQSLTRKY